MLLSSSHNFLLIHVQKTGGDSLTRLLQTADPSASFFLNKHDRLVQAQDQFTPDAWASLFKFAFVRNPWDRLVSWYTMIQERLTRKSRPLVNQLWQYMLDNSNSFEEFILNCHEPINDRDGIKSFWFNQLDFLTDASGHLGVDFIGRQETFQEDTTRLFQHLGLSLPPLIHHNRSQHQHYSLYYSDRTRDVVAEGYQRDIEYFGYTFDDRRDH